jgi:hypothetical protein
LVRLPVYAFAFGGILLLLARGAAQLRTRTMLTDQVGISEPSYPILNPKAQDTFEVHGLLPATIPVTSFIAVYKTDVERTNLKSTPCQRLHDLGRQENWFVTSVKTQMQLPVTTEGEHFHVRALMDHFLPGACNWHLSELSYQLTFKDAPPRAYPFGPGKIVLLDALEQAAQAQKGGSFAQGPTHVWCAATLKRSITPYFPVLCSNLIEYLQRNPAGWCRTWPRRKACRAF